MSSCLATGSATTWGFVALRRSAAGDNSAFTDWILAPVVLVWSCPALCCTGGGGGGGGGTSAFNDDRGPAPGVLDD